VRPIEGREGVDRPPCRDGQAARGCCSTRLGRAQRRHYLVAVTGVDGKVIHPQHIGVVLILELLPACDVVIDKRPVVAELRPVEHGGLGNAPDLLGNIGTRLTVDRILLLGKEPRMAFPVIGRSILQALLPDGYAQVTCNVPLRAFVDRVPRCQVRVPVGPAVVVLGDEYHVFRTDLLKQARPFF